MRKERTQRYLFILLLVLLPVQLGLHFWPSWAYINGIRIDYLSPTLFFTDLLVLALFILEILLEIQKPKVKRQKFKIKVRSLLLYCFIGLLILLNVYFSLSPAVSVYKWLKAAEFGFLVYWMAKNGKLVISGLWLVFVPVLFEGLLAIWQFWGQSSVGGWWYWLGERTFNATTQGIANAYIGGALVLRPYGTFPHPNVLGGFLAVVMPWLWDYFLHNSRRLTEGRTMLKVGVLVLGYVTLWLSMSRAAIILGTAATVFVLGKRFGRQIVPVVVLLLGIGTVVLTPRLNALRSETEPIVVREQLDALAIWEFGRSPVLGMGLGTAPLFGKTDTAIRNYALMFQPTHNIYLLILSETGVLGLGLAISLAIMVWRRAGYQSRLALATILLLGLFDHYFLTLQQGQLLLAVVLGMGLGGWENK